MLTISSPSVGSSFDTTESPTVTPPRLRAPSMGSELSMRIQASPRSELIEIPSPLGSPVGRFRGNSGSSLPSDFVSTMAAGVTPTHPVPSDPVEALALAEAELRSTWDYVRSWNRMGFIGSSYEGVPDELSTRFERVRSLVCSNETLEREIQEVEGGLRIALDPPRSARDIGRGISPLINLHFEFLLGAMRRSMCPPATSTVAPSTSEADIVDSDSDESSTNSSSDADDGFLHFGGWED